MKDMIWDYRMVYAPHPDFIEWAAEIGANWVVVDSFGHFVNNSADGKLNDVVEMLDDVPALLACTPEVLKHRDRYSGLINADINRVNALIDHAHAKNMKAAVSCYEVSFPAEVRKAFPELWNPPIVEIQRAIPEMRWLWSPCLSDQRVRELLISTIREVMNGFRNADGLIYSFHESMFNATVTHRCERCRNIPYAQMLRWLYDCIKAGVEGSSSHARIFVRNWGLIHSEDVYWANAHRAAEWNLVLPDKPNPAYAPSIEHLRYSPQRDFPQFLKLMQGEDVTFVSKLTYGDYNLGQPSNPWIDRINGFEHIGEISFEHVSAGKRTFTLIPDQIERFADVARHAGLTGIALVPYSWGVRGTHPVSYRFWAYKRADLGLNAGNFACAGEAFKANPQPLSALHDWLCRRYGETTPSALAELLTRTEKISSALFSWNGVSYLMNFDLSYRWGVMDSPMNRRLNALWYASHYEDGFDRIRPTADNIKRIFTAHDEALGEAELILKDAELIISDMPEEAKKEIMDHLQYYRDWMETVWLSQRIMLRLFSLEEGTVKMTPLITEQLFSWFSRRTYLTANSPSLAGMWQGHMPILSIPDKSSDK